LVFGIRDSGVGIQESVGSNPGVAFLVETILIAGNIPAWPMRWPELKGGSQYAIRRFNDLANPESIKDLQRIASEVSALTHGLIRSFSNKN